jgi:hypothetical protein
MSETKDFLDESPADAGAGSAQRLSLDTGLSGHWARNLCRFEQQT